MAEMTPAELTGAIKALEEMRPLLLFISHREIKSALEDWLDSTLAHYRTQLAAQPPAVDRERRLREALACIDHQLQWIIDNGDSYQSSALIDFVSRIKDNYIPSDLFALADQPPPGPREVPEVIPGTLDALAALGAQRDPRDAALEKAEKALDVFARAYRVSMEPFAPGIDEADGASHWLPGAWPSVREFKEANEALAAIRAARGKA